MMGQSDQPAGAPAESRGGSSEVPAGWIANTRFQPDGIWESRFQPAGILSPNSSRISSDLPYRQDFIHHIFFFRFILCILPAYYYHQL